MKGLARDAVAHRSLLLLSNSRNAEGRFLEHARDALAEWLDGRRTVAFVPWAGVTISADAYSALVQRVLQPLGVTVTTVPDSRDAADVVRDAEALLVGGGNTFHLLARAQRLGVLPLVKSRVLAGMPYCGWSAGAVLAGPSIATTNDMPIVWPAGLEALGLVGCQINAHFTDAHPPGFRGETRRERLAEYLVCNPTARVVGLPEGDWLRVRGERITLDGPHDAWGFSADGTSRLVSNAPVQDWMEPSDVR